MRIGIFPVLNFCGGPKVLYNALLEKETSDLETYAFHRKWLLLYGEDMPVDYTNRYTYILIKYIHIFVCYFYGILLFYFILVKLLCYNNGSS